MASDSEVDQWALDLWTTLTTQLQDENNIASRDLSLCGEECIRVLGADWRCKDTPRKLDQLAQAAHESMSRAYQCSQPTLCWRRLYTDACILRSLVACLNPDSTSHSLSSTEIISRLDHAIIVAGAAGDGRLEIILTFISRIQRGLTIERSSIVLLSSPRNDVVTLPDTFSRPIPRLEDVPSLAAFLRQHSRRPFILSGFVLDWPALNEHPWHSVDYLRSVAGPGRIVPVEVGEDYRNDDWTQKLIPWDDFLDVLASSHENVSAPVLYLAQHDMFKQFPVLRDDIIIPDYVYASPPPPDNFPSYSPPANDDQLVINAWLGPGGTVSPAHTDPFFNLYAQVVGRKTVWLAPPEATPYMCAYPQKGSSYMDQPHNPAANNINPSMSNTSQLDVFTLSDQSDAKIPLFREYVIPQAMCTTLERGDLLFFPPGWWHAMRSEETSFSVSMWF